MRFLAFLFLLSGIAAAAGTEFKPVERPTRPTLIGGTPVDPADFPAVLYTSQGGSLCTSTLIGPRTLLTASHCVRDGGSASFTLAGRRYSSVCKHHPDYDENETADWALCYVSAEVVGIHFETLSMNRAIPQVGDYLLLTGYGCTNSQGQGGNDGILRSGRAKVVQIPSAGDWDIVTKGDVALCFGDSGGPAFYEYPDGRVQVSVNSRGDIRETSYLSKTLANDVFSGWLRAWSQAHGTKVCGLDGHDCRPIAPTLSPTPEPSPDPKPPAGPLTWWDWLIIVGAIIGLSVVAWWVKSWTKTDA